MKVRNDETKRRQTVEKKGIKKGEKSGAGKKEKEEKERNKKLQKGEEAR